MYGAILLALLLLGVTLTSSSAQTPDLGDRFAKQTQPLLKTYCLSCHSTKAHKGDLDLERFTSIDLVKKDLKVWQHVIEQVSTGEMPPKEKPQPSAEEKKALLAWAREVIDTESRARKGDPGRVPLRRLSNAEYDCTIRDLTGVDLKPTREFPADGAAGEGFTNAAEALTDITPTLFTRYLNAAKDIADHAVLLPDGFRFSPKKTRRDWTDESVARLRKFYKGFPPDDGRLSVQPYVLATVRHREALASGKMTPDQVAAQEKVNPKYLGILWQTLNEKSASPLMERIRARWREATEKDAGPLAAEINEWQTAIWKFVPIGSYRYFAVERQVANDPAAGAAAPIKLAVKPAPGKTEVVVYLAARDLTPATGGVVWHRPRFEVAGKPPLLLKDYPDFGVGYEIDLAAIFGDTAKYLNAAAALAHDKSLMADDVAQKENLDAALLKKWVAVLAIQPVAKNPSEPPAVAAVALELLDQKTGKNDKQPPINGWRRADAELPVLVSNSSNDTLQIPGTMKPHTVAVHPTPQEFSAVAWKSPIKGKVDVTARVTHIHPACGNGIAWWFEHRRGGKAVALGEGNIERGAEEKTTRKLFDVEPGDHFVLAVDPRDGNHYCDLTEINLTISADGKTWDLAADVADTVQEANPHADKHGNKDVWSFVHGKAKTPPKAAGKTPTIPPNSILGQWRVAAADPAQRAQADKLAGDVQSLLKGARPANEGSDRTLYDVIVSVDGVLLTGVDVRKILKARPEAVKLGLPKDRFGRADAKPDEVGDLFAAANSVIEIRLPAALLRERELVVDGKVDGPIGERLTVFQATTALPSPDWRWNGKSPIVGSPTSAAYKQELAGFAEFRKIFPWFLCFPNVVPTDEVVSLKMFHREDEPLERLFLNAEQKRELDHLWEEQLFISQQAVAENNYLPQFIGFVTQDQPKELLQYFEGQRPVFKKRADEAEAKAQAAEPKQLAALVDFAARAYRRPLREKEKAELMDVYSQIRKKVTTHDEAFRGTLARVLVAPAFLFRIEKAPAGVAPGPIDDWELATRLSYFLWSSQPDDELRKLAAAGSLRDPKVLAEQTRRMIKDARLRSLAIEFGTQWIHVRDIDNLKEKNEKLFPTFNAALRKSIYEESILFFQDLFQADRPVTHLLDADATFLDETLAKHYGIPGVSGPEWRRVEGVRKYGRGGILGLASVQAKQSGASRTSPVLRGNWVVETLLGEKLPRPPANVPILPDEEGNDKLTTRQLTEKHVSVASCRTCHIRIDPYGFAFENFDAIGRWRVKESSGLPVDTKASLRDGTEFTGIDGLRDYLLTKKKDVIVRLFCQRLLGYALGRATTLSDTSVIDEMVAEMNKNDGRVSAAVLAIVRSPQFRMIRGKDVAIEN